MTIHRIKKVALAHFARHGYEGASLAHIADEVGIKKPSIYAHFKGKDDLFLKVIEDVISDEAEFVTHFFARHANIPLHERLYNFLSQYKARYEHDDRTKFLLRITFFPPTHLYDEVMHDVYIYLDKLEGLLIPVFEKAIEEGEIRSVGAERAAVAFMGLLDGLLVEMLYGGTERFIRRLHASWYLYWRGLSI
ncbi:TetR/AcrR family transcriptional regulator [Aneurinibacillus thermoaerophilus]|jgi:AcrR family transcriptional regulator|uniref:DNA-binding transcriptional regulator, AcrR family n=1 Tax=Aneurinibacillus thermoaerophilus TaxID=143495 RepID=A0A1G8AXH5_ANETH|nr:MULTISPECIES: TetR/AcrR family transcriptional regulator [Aneurinibacillus]AMA72811.1 TetR family transcriptional regulator [Aneurinibacillus sp. XH2]MED0675194.1 TetR/AcrR family transcriptional regulator [Aneurinibacillus thermoaerophilus]MED0680110.1 TetR/AcrR family transcriptional regulator [Aneurinibacillus thermoaerophilus]MED0758250.1 TetR/AcrR family transcriptional regulator [Aneurinibacillus thermoaerophilus]MED0761404.1 TetR/AcrR family transcriptional regulator [Aneurinibacillu